jgi:trigger factor
LTYILQNIKTKVRKVALKIEKQTLEDHQVKLTVEVEEKTFEDAKRRAAKKVSKQTKIPGFRPGRAPYNVVVRQVGEPVILEEALDILVQDIYPKIIEEADIQPYGPGKLENVESMEPPVLEFIVPLDAEVNLGDYHAIRKTYEPGEVSEKQVDEVIEDLQERQAILEPVDRPVDEGDVVYTQLSAVRTESDSAADEADESQEDTQEPEDLTLIPERPATILIRAEEAEKPQKSEQSDEEESEEDEPEEWPFPGFSRQLIGFSKGDEKTITHTFTEDTQFESLRGVEAVFHLRVDDLKSRTLPELDDEFAKLFGDYETIEELRAEIRSQLEDQAREKYNESYEDEILEQAVEEATILYPPQMLEDEVESVIHNLEHRLENQRMDMDLYLRSREMNMEDLREEVLPMAESRLKRMLFLYELAKAEDIQLDQAEIQTEATLTMQNLKRNLSEEDARKLSNRQVYNNLVTNVMADMITQRATERFRKIASGEYEEEQADQAEQEEEKPEGEVEMTSEEQAQATAEVEESDQTEATPEAEETPEVVEVAAVETEEQHPPADPENQMESDSSDQDKTPED